MKGVSVGLESTIKLSCDEVERLNEEVLEGELVFREVGEDDIKVKKFFSLSVNDLQVEIVAYESLPRNVYFGDAERINFCLNSEAYCGLLKEGCVIERFGFAGKLRVYDEDKYSGKVGGR